MKEKEYSKGFLKDKFTEYHVTPPESVWNHISARLGGTNRRGLVIVLLSAAATIALAVTLGITFFGEHKLDQGAISEAAEGEQKVEKQLQEPVREEADVKPGQIAPVEREAERRQSSSERLAATGQRTASEAAAEGSPGNAVEQEPAGRLGREVEGILEEMEAGETMDEGVRMAGVQGSEPVLTDTLPAADGMEEAGPVLSGEAEEAGVAELPLPGKERTGESGRRDARWIVGAAMSPLYSFRDAEAGALGSEEGFESGMVAYAGGVHVSYRAAKRLAIESGIYYNKMGVDIGAPGIRLFDSSFEASPMDGASSGRSNWVAVANSIGNIVTKSGDIYVNQYKLNATSEMADYAELNNQEMIAADEGIRQHLDYLEIPLNVRYTVLDRTFELQLVGGMSTNFLVQNYITMDTPSGPEEIGYLTNIRNVNYSGNAGLGMVYHLHRQISLRLEPRFRYFLNSVNDASLPSTRPYSLGLYTGFTYTF